VLAAISGENSLATLGGVVAKIQEVAVSDNDSAIRELIRLVEADIVLTTKILHVVNSVSAGVSRRVATIDEAVVLLGFNKIKNLCIGIACIEKLGVESRCKNFDRTHLWHHSLGTALASRLIENLLADAETGDLFVAGLLCNVGRVILDQHFPQELARILKLAEERRIRVIEAEREVLGATHAEIGYWALKAWNIDDKLARIVRDHHGPLGTREADIINLAYVLTQIMGLGSPGDSMLAQLIPGVLERLGFDELKFGELFMALDREYRAAEPMLKIMTETAPKPA